ncbi:SDR family NAD(P)-dependent oxidoreductase [Legionella spiritensis]|uniref:SDR family NAD(P)-dependent oxidoreductase n=1 Tax=Legionella spiritensis TaxID=452 RepID=UPI000F6EA830|nr:SDR family NAD(P)-dependent oxidoreductase [Legionella spiritensis]VEG92158.1 polyketide synthase, type I [Legionella spiritensis]
MAIAEFDSFEPTDAWKTYLYALRWQRSDWQPDTKDVVDIPVLIAARTLSSERKAWCKRHFNDGNIRFIEAVTIDDKAITEQETAVVIYLCQADGNELLEEADFLRRVTQSAMTRTSVMPFVFLNLQSPLTGVALLGILKSIKFERPQWVVNYMEGDLLNERGVRLIKSVYASQESPNWVFRVESGILYTQTIYPAEPGVVDGARLVYPQHTYLVTGASGDLGQIIIENLLDSGVKNIAATGRKKEPPLWSLSIQAHLQNGAKIYYYSSDVSSGDDVKKLISVIKEQLPPLGSITHAAGVSDDKPWRRTDRQNLYHILSGKAMGALYLHQATRDYTLKEFICISSITGVFGNLGQGAYAAANAFLNALCDYRMQQGLPALALIAGPIHNTGLFRKNERRLTAYLASLGVQPLTSQDIKQLSGRKVNTSKIIFSHFLRLPEDSTDCAFKLLLNRKKSDPLS